MKLRVCRFKIKNLNIAKLVNLLYKNNIDCKNLVVVKDYATFEVANKHCENTQKILLANKYDFQILLQNSPKLILRRLIASLGLLVGIICSFCIIFVGNLFCYGYKVDTTDPKITSQIQVMLKHQKLSLKPRSNIDFVQLEDMLRQEIDRLAFVQIYFDGGILVVQAVVEHQQFQPKPIYSKIVASKDCVISSVQVFGGTALVKVGDVVKKGQVLIDGYILVGHPDDPNSVKEPCEASGEVRGLKWHNERIRLVEQTIQLVPVPKTMQNVSIKIFGWEWKGKKQCDYEIYSTTTTSTTFGTLFPITYTKTVYTQLKTQESALTEQEIDNIIFEKQQEILLLLKDSQKVCRNWKIEKRLDNLYIIDIYYELDEVVGIGD